MLFKNTPSCLGLDIDLFFVEDNCNYLHLDLVKRMCSTCPALDECFEYAENNLVQGIWAGTTYNEREAHRRKYNIVGKPVVPISLVRDHLEGLDKKYYGRESIMAEIELVAFDLDGTLAPSKSPLPEEMAEKLIALLDIVPVCIISGGNLPQFKSQVLSQLTQKTNWENLHLMPTCGTRYLRYSGTELRYVYENNIDEETRQYAMRVLKEEAIKLGFWENDSYGDIIEDRGSQVTYSALGQQAPEHEKKMWDPSGEKRLALRNAVAKLLPELEVRAGGSTSIDITQKGIDKAYGMRKLSDETGIPLESMLFIGDRLDEGGNDYPVISTGAMTFAVDGWEETVKKVDQVIKELL